MIVFTWLYEGLDEPDKKKEIFVNPELVELAGSLYVGEEQTHSLIQMAGIPHTVEGTIAETVLRLMGGDI